jgi:uncharacterized phiE125 gp8 family phage protein
MASLVRVTETTEAVISLAEAKAQLNLDLAESDALVAGYTRAAQDWVGAAIGRPLLDETWRYVTDGWASEITIPMPVRDVTAIAYLDEAGAEQTLAPASYVTIGDVVSLAYGETWPALRRQADAVRVTFTSGFGPDHNYVPEALREACMLLVGRMFLQRESVLESGYFESSIVETMIAPYRVRQAEVA